MMGLAAAAKLVCALRSARIVLSCSAEASSRSRRRTRLWVASLMFLMVSLSALTTLVGAELMISPSLSCVTRWISFIFLVRSASRVVAGRGQERRSLRCEARALRRQLQAGGEARNVRALRSIMVTLRCRSTMPAPAEIAMVMPAMTATGGEQAALTPQATEEATDS